MINEFRFTYGRRTFTNRGLGTGGGKAGELGVPNVSPENFPTVNLVGYTRLGTNNQERIQKPIITYQYVDSLSWYKGKHSFKAGFEMRYSRNKDDFNRYASGSFNFTNRFVGDALGSLLLGHTQRGQIVDTDILNTRTDYYGAYLQDNWKATNKLTVSLGLRWEIDTPRWEKQNHQSGFDADATNPVCDCPGIVTFSGLNGRNQYAHGFDKNNFGPRVGLAYRPTNTIVVRAGYGINYNGAYAFAVPFTQFWSFSKTLDLVSPDGGRSAVFQLSDGLPAVQPFTDADRNASFGAVAGGRRTTSPDFIQQDHHNAQSQQWNFTVQKQLPNAVLIEAQYLANVAHNLGGVNVNINQIPLDANGQGPASQSRALTPYPQFNQVVLESPAWGNSTYHALNLKAEKRFARGLSYLVNYTWSKFLDDVEANNEAGGGQGAGYTHLSLRRLDKALSGNDIRHRIVASGVWELPVKLNNKAANTILGGWSLGVIAEFRTGSPYGVIEQTNRSNTFSPGQRPHLVGAPELSSSRSTGDRIAEWFNTAAFEQPGAGVFGGSPRTLCCGPGQAVVDTSINKKFFFSESKHVEFRADFFNIANTPNFALPELRRGNGGFGRIRGTVGTGRQLQLGLHLQF